MQKYKLDKFEIKNINGNKKKLYRIKALKDFSDVKTGEIGGFVESENNLSQEVSCWIYGDAIVIQGLRKIRKIIFSMRAHQGSLFCLYSHIVYMY